MKFSITPYHAWLIHAIQHITRHQIRAPLIGFVNRKYFFYLALLLGSHSTALSQGDTEMTQLMHGEETPISFAHLETIDSKVLDEKRTINIYLPESFHETSDDHTYPVLLLLEDEFFLMVTGVVNHLSAVERMPETIVVSLVDGPQTPKLYTNGSDFWPKDWKQLPFGGDPKPFSEHLEKELLPYLKDKYRANDFGIILGLSGTSIYALHTFIKEADLFDAHIAIASGDILGMGYDEGVSLIDLAVSDFQRGLKREGYLYVTSADSDAISYAPKIKSNLEELERRLSPYRSSDFKFVSRLFPNEGHYDVALPALLEALELIFSRDRWSAEYNEIIAASGNAMQNIDNYFQDLSELYDFVILPKTERWNSGNSLSRIGPRLLREGRVSEGIEVIERWSKYAPKSRLALLELSKAYEANDELRKAIAALERAQGMMSTSDMNESEGIQKEIERLKDVLTKRGN